MEELYSDKEILTEAAGEMPPAPEAALFADRPDGETDAEEPYGEEPAAAAPEAEDGFTEEELRAWEEFRLAYPELTPENIPEDVFRLVSGGETPVHAMRQVELAQLKAENASLRQRLAAAENERRNRARTPGSMLGRVPAPEDAFLTGLEL